MVNTSTVKQCWNYPALFKTPLSVSNNQISYRKKKDLLSRPNPHSQPQETRIKPIEGKQEHARALCSPLLKEGAAVSALTWLGILVFIIMHARTSAWRKINSDNH